MLELRETFYSIVTDVVRGSTLLAWRDFKSSMFIYSAAILFCSAAITYGWRTGERYGSAIILFPAICLVFTLLRSIHAYRAYRLSKELWRSEE